jgi:acylphosphatase
LKTLHILVCGRVQGVGFRQFTAQKALNLNLLGWVRNLKGGVVEALVRGEPASLEALVREIHIGPMLSRVDQVRSGEVQWTGDLIKFRIVEDGDKPCLEI